MNTGHILPFFSDSFVTGIFRVRAGLKVQFTSQYRVAGANSNPYNCRFQDPLLLKTHISTHEIRSTY